MLLGFGTKEAFNVQKMDGFQLKILQPSATIWCFLEGEESINTIDAVQHM